MNAGTLIRAAMDAGVALKFEDGKIKACGHADVVSLWAPRLREHKAALIEALQPYESSALSEASNDPKPPTTTTATPAPARKPTGQCHQECVQAWKPMADAYHQHHFSCPTCIAAGKGYGLRCGAGSVLYRAYEDTS